MKVAILGGGFGLYGYLPALLQLPNISVLLSARYQKRLKERDEVCRFYDQVEWVDDDRLLAICDAVIIAQPPMQQYNYAHECLRLNNIKYMFLEKPLAPTPLLADELLRNLEAAGKRFRIGYNFRYTEWGKAVLERLVGLKTINWDFCAHHYLHDLQNWKRLHSEGGGALRFYGIHLIALLAELGYQDTSYSAISSKTPNEAENWTTELIGTNLPPCKIHIATHSNRTLFDVILKNRQTVSLTDPFQSNDSKKNELIDRRVPILIECLSELFSSDQRYYEWYCKVNLLWLNIEKRTVTL